MLTDVTMKHAKTEFNPSQVQIQNSMQIYETSINRYMFLVNQLVHPIKATYATLCITISITYKVNQFSQSQ